MLLYTQSQNLSMATAPTHIFFRFAILIVAHCLISINMKTRATQWDMVKMDMVSVKIYNIEYSRLKFASKSSSQNNHENNIKILGLTGQFSSVLQMTEIYSVERYQCEKEHQDEKRPTFRLHSRFSCFQEILSGSCSGDGGGPMVCPIEPESDKYMHVNTHFTKTMCIWNKYNRITGFL